MICFYLARSIVKDDFGTWGKDRRSDDHRRRHRQRGRPHAALAMLWIFYCFTGKTGITPRLTWPTASICVGAVLLVIDGFKHKKDKAV